MTLANPQDTAPDRRDSTQRNKSQGVPQVDLRSDTPCAQARVISARNILVWGVLALGAWLAGCGRPEGTIQMPEQASTVAADVDWLYYFIFWVSVVSFVGIVGTMVVFVIKYRQREGGRAEPTGHSNFLEIFWTFSPLIVLAMLFHWGFQGYVKGSVAPPDALEIRVRGMQWQWEFEYPNGAVDIGNLRVPANTPVKLVMSSQDVLHSFFVPTFRVKRDVVPGMYTSIWFNALEENQKQMGADGKAVACNADDDCGPGFGCIANQCTQFHQVFCAEYCGAPLDKGGNVGHSGMLARVAVVSQQEYDTFMQEGPAMPPSCEADENPAACWGRQLYETSGCPTCHGVDGVAQAPAPNFKGLYGRQEKIADGSSVMVDENYVRESILMPQAKIVDGYTGVIMPAYRFSDRQLGAIIGYIRSLAPEAGTAQDGAQQENSAVEEPAPEKSTPEDSETDDLAMEDNANKDEVNP